MYKPKGRKKSVILTSLEEKEKESAPQVLDRDLFAVLINIQEKLNSPVFNGGFERLQGTVDTIAELQQKMQDDFSAVNKAIYEPDVGLYARVKSVEKTDIEHHVAIEVRVKALEEQKISSENHGKLAERVKKLEDRGTSLKKFMYVAVPLFATGIAKVIYDFVVEHVFLK